MSYFFFRLLPPRSTFPADMTAAEAAAMQQHAAYWSDHLERGTVVVFGPVADPRGTYGIAVVHASEEHARALAADDPVIKAGLGFSCELHPMPAAIVGLPR